MSQYSGKVSKSSDRPEGFPAAGGSAGGTGRQQTKTYKQTSSFTSDRKKFVIKVKGSGFSLNCFDYDQKFSLYKLKTQNDKKIPLDI